MIKNSLQYVQIAPNFRLITNFVDRNEIKFSLNLTAAGSYLEEEGEKGVTHLLEHCMPARTKNLDIEELKSYLFQKDIFTNAYTGRSEMEFVVSGHKDYAEEMLDLILEFGLNPKLTQEVFDIEKEVVLREMDQYKGGSGYRLNRILINSMYEPESFYISEVLGEKEDVANANLNLAKKILRRMYDKSNFILTITGGGIEFDKVVRKLNPYLNKLSSENTIPLNYHAKNYLKKFTFLPVIADYGSNDVVLKIILFCPVTYDNRPVRSYLRELLFESPMGELYDLLRNRKGFIYSLQHSFDLSSDTLTIELSCDISKVKEIIDEVKSLFLRFENIFTEEKVNIVKNLLVKRKEINEDDPDFVVEFMVNLLMDFGVLINYEDYVSLIEYVTLEDIKELYDYIGTNIEKMQVVAVSNNKEIRTIMD